MALSPRAPLSNGFARWLADLFRPKPKPRHTLRLGCEALEGREVPAVVTPVWSDTIVDSVGVNTHLNNSWDAYADYTNSKNAISQLGVRHIRDYLNIYGQTTFLQQKNVPLYNDLGVKSTLIASAGLDAQRLDLGFPLVGNESFEDPGTTGYIPGWGISGDVNNSFVESFYHSGPSPGGWFVGNNYTGTNYGVNPYKVATFQTLTGMANGSYTVTVNVKTISGNPNAVLYAQGFGGVDVSTPIPISTANWQRVVLDNVNVTNGQVAIGIYTDAQAGEGIWFDNFQVSNPHGQFVALANRAAGVSQILDAIEGDNEIDTPNNQLYSYKGTWGINAAQVTQQDLYNTFKSHPVLGTSGLNIPIVQASFGATPAPFDPRVTNIGYADYGNIHPYRFYGNNPGKDLTDGERYKDKAQNVTPGKPLVATEYGWDTTLNDGSWGVRGDLTDSISARYTLRGVAEQYLNGFSRSFIYNLFGTGDGLFYEDTTAKPRATAVRNLIGLLSDNSWDTVSKTWARSSFAGTPFDYTLNAPPTVHQILTQKSDGYYLMLWNEVDNWDENYVDGNGKRGREVNAAPVSVTLTTNGAPTTNTLYSFDGTGNYTTSFVNMSGNQATFNVNDAMTILKIPVPQGYKFSGAENSTQTFATPVNLAFGANGRYNSLVGVSGAFTFNNTTFGDPAPGFYKSGYVNPYSVGPAENGSQTFTTPVDVAYGANGSYSYIRGVSGTVNFNNDTFGDPAVNVAKTGYYLPFNLAGAQGTTMTFADPVDLAYGVNGSFYYKYNFTGTITFNDANFGDPVPYIVKSGYFRAASATSAQLLSATSSSPTKLVWTDVTGETGYAIERKTGTGAYAQVTTVGANVTKWFDTSIAASTTYTYRIRAIRGVNYSTYSGEKTVSTPAFTTLANDNFDATTNGAVPTGWTRSTPAGTTAGVQAFPSGTNKSLRLTDTSATALTTATRSFTAATDWAIMSFRFYASGDGLTMQLTGGGLVGVDLALKAGKLIYRDATGTERVIASYTANTWYTVKIAASVSQGRFDLYLNGNLAVAWVPLRNKVTKFDAVTFGTSAAGTGTYYIDDLVIQK
jgi:hypothetical protein